jgi:hypothetical protein
MRSVLAVAMVVSLVAVPCLGVVNIKLVADQTALVPGQTTTIRILAESVGGAVYGVGGQIDAAGTPGCLTANYGSFAWVPEMDPTPAGFLLPKLGWPGVNGGWNSFGSVQTYAGMHSNPAFGNGVFVEVASYTVTCVGIGEVTLRFSPKWYSTRHMKAWVHPHR